MQERNIPIYRVPMGSSAEAFIRENYVTYIKDFIEASYIILNNNFDKVDCAYILIEGDDFVYPITLTRTDMYTILSADKFISKLEKLEEYELCRDFIELRTKINN